MLCSAFQQCKWALVRFCIREAFWHYTGEPHDFIFAPVANDDVYTTFTLYSAGVLTKGQTLEALKIKKLYNQLVLSSEKALSYLNFIGIDPQEEL